MKKYILVLLAVLGLGFAASAQKAQLQIGYGGYTQMDGLGSPDCGGKLQGGAEVLAGSQLHLLVERLQAFRCQHLLSCNHAERPL